MKCLIYFKLRDVSERMFLLFFLTAKVLQHRKLHVFSIFQTKQGIAMEIVLESAACFKIRKRLFPL